VAPVVHGTAWARVTGDGDDRGADLVLPGAETGQGPGRHIVTGVEQAQQDVLAPDVVVTVGHRLAYGSRHDLPGQRGVGLGRDRRLGMAGDLRDLLTHDRRADPEPFQRLGRHALASTGQGQQKLLGARAVEAEPIGLGPGLDHDVAGVVGEGHESGNRGPDAGLRLGVEGPQSPADP
jgi:hypothetical protein